jgi:hypothetical protein
MAMVAVPGAALSGRSSMAEAKAEMPPSAPTAIRTCFPPNLSIAIAFELPNAFPAQCLSKGKGNRAKSAVPPLDSGGVNLPG